MSSLVVVVVVAVGEASHPATLGAANAARQLLGTDLTIEMREFETVPNDERAQATGTALRATAVVELVWDIPEHRQARIRFHLDRQPGWSERLIHFDEGDDLRERGRTVGYAIASMMAGSEPERAAPPRPPPVPDTRIPPFRAPSPAEPSTKTRTRRALDVAAAIAMGVGGPAGGWGGSLSGRWYFAPPLGVRIGLSARTGQVTPAQATSFLAHLAAGMVWVPLTATPTRPFELGARLDALLMREQLTHFDADDADIGPVTQMRWLPGADAAIEGLWLFSPSAGFLGTFATEVAFGQTDVTTQLVNRATIPPLRLVLQAGVRANF